MSRISFAPKGAKVAEFKIEEPPLQGVKRVPSEELSDREMRGEQVPKVPPEDYRRYVFAVETNAERGKRPVNPLSRAEYEQVGPRPVYWGPLLVRTEGSIPETTTETSSVLPWKKRGTSRRKRTTRRRRSQKKRKWTSSGTRRRN